MRSGCVVTLIFAALLVFGYYMAKERHRRMAEESEGEAATVKRIELRKARASEFREARTGVP